MPETQPKSVQTFLDYLRYERRYSPHTVTSYELDLTQWTAYLASAYESPAVGGCYCLYGAELAGGDEGGGHQFPNHQSKNIHP